MAFWVDKRINMNINRSICMVLFVGFTFVLSMDTARADRAPDPTDQMRPFVHKIVAILTDESLQGKAHCYIRRHKVMAAAHERFDFNEMSKRVLGKQWRKISVAEKQHFVDLFTKLLEHAYIGKIEDYSKQTVEFKTQRVRGKRAEVRTVLHDRNVTIPVSYIMFLEHDKWMVYDIIVEGVSLIRNYMEQFRDILHKQSYPDFVQKLEDKVKKLDQASGKTCPVDLAG